jgi:hypothetical protein
MEEIKLEQKVKIKLTLLNLLALNKIETSLLTDGGIFLFFYNFNLIFMRIIIGLSKYLRL